MKNQNQISSFDMGSTTNSVKTFDGASGFLKPGICEMYFKGITKDIITTSNGQVAVIDIAFEAVNGGQVHSHRLFAPTSNQRTTVEYQNGPVVNPSHLEQFMCFCRQLIEALNPELNEKINSGEFNLTAPSFNEFSDLLIRATKNAVDKVVELKLLPNGQYVTLPKYPAKISKKGELYIATRFIGKNLTMSASELTLINKANNASPTSMSSSQDALHAMGLGMDSTITMESSIDDLPF